MFEFNFKNKEGEKRNDLSVILNLIMLTNKNKIDWDLSFRTKNLEIYKSKYKIKKTSKIIEFEFQIFLNNKKLNNLEITLNKKRFNNKIIIRKIYGKITDNLLYIIKKNI